MINDSFLFKRLKQDKPKKIVRAKITQTSIIGVRNLIQQQQSFTDTHQIDHSFTDESEQKHRQQNVADRSCNAVDFQDETDQRSLQRQKQSQNLKKQLTLRLNKSSPLADFTNTDSILATTNKIIDTNNLISTVSNLENEFIHYVPGINEDLDQTSHSELIQQLSMPPRDYFNLQRQKDFQNFSLDELVIDNVMQNQDYLPIQTQDACTTLVYKLKPNLQDQIKISNGQLKYIESLKLKETCHQTYEIISQSLDEMGRFFNEERQDLSSFNSYILLTDLTKRKLFLDQFNEQFSTVCSHIVQLANFISAKEQSYLTKIEQLTRHNQVLLQENLQLSEKINRQPQQMGVKAEDSDLSVQAFDEFSNLILNKLDQMKQRLWDPSETGFASGNSLNVKTLPLQNKAVLSVVQVTIDKVENICVLMNSTLQKCQTELAMMRREAGQNAEKVLQLKRQSKAMQQKLLPKVERLFKVDLEYLRCTIDQQRTEMGQILKGESEISTANIIQMHEQLVEKLVEWHSDYRSM